MQGRQREDAEVQSFSVSSNWRIRFVRNLDSKKGTVTFSNVQKVPAYVSAAYDPSGAWDAQSPPPSGSSLGMHSRNPPNPQPIDVAPGKSVKVSITFDDSV